MHACRQSVPIHNMEGILALRLATIILAIIAKHSKSEGHLSVEVDEKLYHSLVYIATFVFYILGA